MRIGVIGYGHRISGFFKNCLLKENPEIKITGVIDPNKSEVLKKLDEAGQKDAVFYDDLKTLMKKGNPDALVIGTRCNLHTPYAIEAAAYNVPLFLEKPVSVTMEQALALEKAWEKAKSQVVVSFPLKVSPLCLHAKSLIAKGAVGKPEHVCATNYVNYGTVYWEQLYRDYSITGGLFLQKATHDLDYISFLMDSPIVRIAAMGTFQHVFGGSKPSGLKCSACGEVDTCLESPGNRKISGAGYHTGDHDCVYSVDCGSPETGTNEDCSSALLEFASGAHGVYTQVFFTRRDASRRGSIVSGYHGTLDMDWYRNDIKVTHHHTPFSDHVKAGDGASHFGGDDELAKDFINIIKNKGKSRTPIQDGLQSVYCCLAARESMQRGEFVKVRIVGW